MRVVSRMAALMVSASALALAVPVAGAELYCLADVDVGWHKAEVRTWQREAGAHGLDGWTEFWVDAESGAWRGRTVGSRALYSEGGAFEIVNDGAGYRADWVGIGEKGFTILRIDLSGGDAETGYPYMRADRDQAIHVGRCRPTDGRLFLDGREQPR
jgi:hypothetical protein